MERCRKETWLVGWMVCCSFAGCDSTTGQVGRTQNAVIGGTLADDPVFDAVLCLPRFGPDGVVSGWFDEIERCAASVTLVTPNIAMSSRDRPIRHSWRLELGARTLGAGAVVDTQFQSALEMGSALNAVDDGPGVLRRATGCLEMRRSGLASCCVHPMARETRDGPWVHYIPPPELWDVPFGDAAAHGMDRVTINPNERIAMESGTYTRHLQNCPNPIAEDDAVISDVIFYLLSERIDESLITPIPLALRYPDGGTDPAWFEDTDIAGDIAGFGFGEPGETSQGFREGIRRVAAGATILTLEPTLTDPSDPASFSFRAHRFTADGGRIPVATALVGDGDRGARHVDWGAPWLFDDGTGLRAFAIASRGGDIAYETHLTSHTAPMLDAFFDRDGDGILRGARDGGLPGRIDADGDGLSEARMEGGVRLDTNNDNCSPPAGATPAQAARYADATQLDRDGDMFGDVCDVCPEVYDPGQAGCVAKVSATAEESPTGVRLEVGDTVGAACLSDPPAADRDNDGALDAWCDNCPPPDAGEFDLATTHDREQRDRDGDGVGDVCDICPDDPTAGLGDDDSDPDGDGVGSACGDNCPLVANPLQENCNEDAELLHGLDPVGDACDPVPCGETRMTLEAVPGSIGDPVEVWSMNTIRVDARSDVMQEARTGFRFCPCAVARTDSVETRLACQAIASCQIDDRTAYDDEALAPELEPPTWRFQSLANLTTPDPDIIDPDAAAPLPLQGRRLEGIALYEPFPASAMFDPRLSAVWERDTDQLRWETIFGNPFNPLEVLPGVLWTHTPGPRPSAFPETTRRLSSHYWSGQMEPTRDVVRPVPCFRHIGPFLGAGICPSCENAFPSGYISLPGRSLPGQCGGPFELPVIELPRPAIDLPELISFDPRIFERPDLTWLGAAEPREWLSIVGPVLVGLDAQLAPEPVFTEGPAGFQLLGDPNCPNCPPVPMEPPFLRAAGAAADPANGVPVLSNREQTLFVLMGDARTKIGSVHARNVVTGEEGVLFDAALGQVLAATYRPHDRSLYILDEVTRARRGWGHDWGRRSRFVRLVRWSPGGIVEVLQEWPRLSWNSRFQLVSDTSGGLWVLASAHHGPHFVARFEERERRRRSRGTAWRTTGWYLGGGTLAQASPRASDIGLSYVVNRGGEEIILGLRASDLWPTRGREMRRGF